MPTITSMLATLSSMSEMENPEPGAVTDGKARRQFFTTIALTGSAELRKHFSLDETNYLRLTLEAQSDARAYLSYSVLDTVYEAGIFGKPFCKAFSKST